MRTSRRIMVAGLVIGLGGCGLMDALDKLKSITFTLPEQKYSVSTDSPNWRSPPTGGIPAHMCGPGQPLPTCCPTGIDCTRSPLSCEAERCALKFTYEQASMLNLAKDVDALKQQGGMIFSDLLLKQLDLNVNNMMNVTTPPVDLYVAPANVTSASGSGVQKIATIPAQTPGFNGKIVVNLDGAGQQAFSSFARNVQTPFNIIMSTNILVKSGDPIPMGRIDFGVSGTVEAKF